MSTKRFLGYDSDEEGHLIVNRQQAKIVVRLYEEFLSGKTVDYIARIYEIRERLTVCRSVIAHLKARKETRWHSFAENMDYPAKSDDWLKYVNSRKENGKIKIIIRDLVRGGDSYEHSDK